MRLNRDFYNQPTPTVAKQLLGTRIIVEQGDGTRRMGIIVETEAYCGARDAAAHTFDGKRTKRTEAMYANGGHVYMYLIYGMHWMLNISTAGTNNPEAVLLRALSVPGKPGVANGPGKLTRYLGLDADTYGKDLVIAKDMWIETAEAPSSHRISAAPRIGISYADEPWLSMPWRFFITDHSEISKK